MATFFPYKIEHVKLDRMPPAALPAVSNHGYYVVYWWKQIPLGDLYIPVNTELSDQAYFERVSTAIMPAIVGYWKKCALDTVPGEGPEKVRDWNSLQDLLGQIFKRFDEVPAVCDISIIICTRNRASYLSNCLLSLQHLQPRANEIIVVDNAPDDQSTKNVVAGFPGVVYHAEPRAGLDIARNSGIMRATSKFVAFMDDDIRAEPNCLAEIATSLSADNIVAMTGLVLAASLDAEAQFIFEKEWSFNRGYQDKLYDQNYFNATLSKGPPVWEIGAGANMAFRRNIFGEVGYFDERLDVGAAGCNGDSEMWFRILSRGYAIAYNPRAVVHHEHRKNLSGLKKQLFNYMKGFTVAALIQQKQEQRAGYYRQLFAILPPWYIRLLARGFPRYRFRYGTVFSEIRGVLAGFIYFLRHRNKVKTNS